MKPDALTADVLELFDRNHITVNSLRGFVVESVADFLGDDEHDRTCGRLFDRWYRKVRRSIWLSAARHVLEHNGSGHKEADDEAKRLYRELYADHDKRYGCWRRDEERRTDGD